VSEVVTLRIAGPLAARLARLAEETHRTKAFYLREALDAHLEDLEDYYLAAELARQVASGEMPAGAETWDQIQRAAGVDPDEAPDLDLLKDVS
jgi:RHH-type rel operon transcriptional repressor/antitoxin RelB